jgi:tRNA threonylcarbamoyladenosine biosynthesis protein TsaB
MALILNIDTAVETASVCLAKDGVVLAFAENLGLKDHAAWLHPAIKNVFEKVSLHLQQTDTVAVTEGPGSYTGLRIGMASAKGICYALNKPLITLNTLMVMARAAAGEEADLLCPMIDARRMEVFAALYTKNLEPVIAPVALMLHEKNFEAEMKSNRICFFGNGSDKFRQLTKNPNALFSTVKADASVMAPLAEEKFRQAAFASLAYAEPLYLKEFYTPAK